MPCGSLAEDKNLRKLKFNQFIGIDNAKIIAKAIQVVTTLQILDLSGNGLSVNGVGVISDSIKNGRSLKELDLVQNDINDE